MLQSLQGIENQGGGKEAKNWIFYVNKQATIEHAPSIPSSQETLSYEALRR